MHRKDCSGVRALASLHLGVDPSSPVVDEQIAIAKRELLKFLEQRTTAIPRSSESETQLKHSYGSSTC